MTSVQDPHEFVRFRDPNEAVGLAMRLIAGSAPFDRLPLGLTGGLLISRIDAGDYGFARRGDLAVGVVIWGFTTEEAAAGFIDRTRPLGSEDLGGGPAGLVFAFRAVDRATTRFLVTRLRKAVFAGAKSLRFIRDYGPGAAGRKPRAVVMRRRAGL